MIGPRFSAVNAAINAALPIASAFTTPPVNFQPGIRINGTSVTAVPEPGGLVLFSIGTACPWRRVTESSHENRLRHQPADTVQVCIGLLLALADRAVKHC